MHPLTPNLSTLTLEELQQKSAELTKRMSMAYKWGNPDMVYQLQMLQEDYQTELRVRGDRALEEMQKNSKKFTNIIDIQ
jgi:hypothetical protein